MLNVDLIAAYPVRIGRAVTRRAMPVLLALAGLTLTALNAVAATPVPSAAQILEKNEAARGGVKLWRGVDSLTLTGKMDLGKPVLPTVNDIALAQRGVATPRRSLAEAGLRRDLPVAATSSGAPPLDASDAKPIVLPFTLEMKRPHKTRLEIVFDKQAAVQTFDGSQGWKYRPFMGKKDVQPFSSDELKAASSQPDLDGMLIDAGAKGNKLAFEKSEKINGRDNFKLRVTLKNGETRAVWIDAQTYLESRVDNKPVRVNGQMRTASTYYSDYRAVNGLLIPHTIETRMVGGGTTGKMLVDSVQVNPALSDARFAKPE